MGKVTNFQFSAHIHMIDLNNGRSQGFPKIFRAPVYMAHRGVIFAIAQHSCTKCGPCTCQVSAWVKCIMCSRSIVVPGVKSVSGMAVDWISQNIYWVDREKVCTILCVVLFLMAASV